MFFFVFCRFGSRVGCFWSFPRFDDKPGIYICSFTYSNRFLPHAVFRWNRNNILNKHIFLVVFFYDGFVVWFFIKTAQTGAPLAPQSPSCLSTKRVKNQWLNTLLVKIHNNGEYFCKTEAKGINVVEFFSRYGTPLGCVNLKLTFGFNNKCNFRIKHLVIYILFCCVFVCFGRYFDVSP